MNGIPFSHRIVDPDYLLYINIVDYIKEENVIEQDISTDGKGYRKYRIDDTGFIYTQYVNFQVHYFGTRFNDLNLGIIFEHGPHVGMIPDTNTIYFERKNNRGKMDGFEFVYDRKENIQIISFLKKDKIMWYFKPTPPSPSFKRGTPLKEIIKFIKVI